MESLFQIVLSCLIGIGLSAACGFKVFAPLLVMSVAAKAGQLELAEGWQWVAGWPALSALAIATTVEIGFYLVPGLDHVLDVAASPAAVIAGTIATAACIADMDPLLRWSAALIAGGGVAGAVQAATVVTRATSAVTTGGLGNPLIAIGESLMAFVMAVLAIVVPIIAAFLVCAAGFVFIRRLLRRRARKMAPLNS